MQCFGGVFCADFQQTNVCFAIQFLFVHALQGCHVIFTMEPADTKLPDITTTLKWSILSPMTMIRSWRCLPACFGLSCSTRACLWIFCMYALANCQCPCLKSTAFGTPIVRNPQSKCTDSGGTMQSTHGLQVWVSVFSTVPVCPLGVLSVPNNNRMLDTLFLADGATRRMNHVAATAVGVGGRCRAATKYARWSAFARPPINVQALCTV
jgi:hypothetical protein